MATAAEQIVDVVTPAAGESVSEGTILEWHVKVGDFIKASDTIVEISTDKVDIELPAPASGTVTEILIAEGETVTVGQVIARISLDGAAPGATDGNGRAAEPAAPPPPQSPSPASSEPAAAAAPAPAAQQPAPPSSAAPAHPADGDRALSADTARGPNGAKVSPVAARAAAVEGVDLSSISGSGPAGRVTKADVLEAASGTTPAPPAPPRPRER